MTPSGTTEGHEGIIMSDGFAIAGQGLRIGPNQDPCVLSSPFAGLHTLCRIARRKGTDNDVVTLNERDPALLADVVEPGDVVFYGRPEPERVAVDTVLVVESTPTFEDVHRVAGKDSPAFEFNLRDAMKGGLHEGQTKQRVIVGRRMQAPSWESTLRLESSFIPLAQTDASGRRRVARVPIPGALELHDRALCGRNSQQAPRICELPAAQGRALAKGLLEGSAGVFIPPVTLQRPMQRWFPPA